MCKLSNLLTTISQSSLTLSLLRCIFTEGKVYYDGLATDTLNLDVLRSNVTIIPQVVRDCFVLFIRSMPKPVFVFLA